MFITFEGIEGSGKSTQIKLLAARLQDKGHKILQTREPGGCPLADKIRALLLDADNSEMVPMTELMLYAAARAQHVNEVILPALGAGAIVLCDRFSDATYAYQSFGRGLPRGMVMQLNQLACNNLAPDLTLLLDCEVGIGLSRARSRISSLDGHTPKEERFELEALSFHQRVRDGYLALSQENPGRFTVIQADQPPDAIADNIANAVFKRLQCAPLK